MLSTSAYDTGMDASSSHVLALTGPFGSGLTAAATRISSKHNFRHIKMAEEIRHEWARRYDDDQPVRADLQRLGDEIRQAEGPGALVHRALVRYQPKPDEPLVIESIKNVGEIHALRRRFGYRLLVVAIIGAFDVRAQKALAVYREQGLDQSHLLEDDQRDRNEEVEYGQQVELCVDMADIILLNNRSSAADDFGKKIDDLISLLEKPNWRALTDIEVHMQAAYSMARSSKCIKRRVGAVLVDRRGQLVAAGFNENPYGTKPCVEEERYSYRCHRDVVRERHFTQLSRQGARCPVCTAPIKTIEGPPWRCATCYAEGRRTNLEIFYFPDRAMNWCTAIHAEVRAIFAAGDRARGAALYTTTFPCMQCADKIAHAGITEVVYTEAYPDPYGSERLQMAGITIRQFEGVRSSAIERLFPNSWLPNH
jgi:deoxycytidylate deaminase